MIITVNIASQTLSIPIRLNLGEKILKRLIQLENDDAPQKNPQKNMYKLSKESIIAKHLFVLFICILFQKFFSSIYILNICIAS